MLLTHTIPKPMLSQGGIKPGYAGHVPSGYAILGSSHVGGLPLREPWAGRPYSQSPRPMGGAFFGRPLAKARIHMTSASEYGRQAWLDGREQGGGITTSAGNTSARGMFDGRWPHGGPNTRRPPNESPIVRI